MTTINEIYEENKKNSAFIKLNEGESFRGVFKGVESADDGQFGPSYKFTFNVDGEDKIFRKQKPAKRFIETLMKLDVKQGDELEITRLGDGFDTQYKVKKLDK